MTTPLMLDTIRQAPKALLHDHLDGGLRPATVLELAEEHGYDALPATDADALATFFRTAAHSGLRVRRRGHAGAHKDRTYIPSIRKLLRSIFLRDKLLRSIFLRDKLLRRQSPAGKTSAGKLLRLQTFCGTRCRLLGQALGLRQKS